MKAESAFLDSSAAVLEPGGVHSRPLNRAMEHVCTALSKGRSNANGVYGVLVFGKRHRHSKHNYLAATGAFLKAYLHGVKALPRFTDILTAHWDQNHVSKLEAKDLGVRLFFGHQASKSVAQAMKPSPGVYILSPHLDEHLLKDLGLPLPPKALRKIRFVMQVQKFDWSWQPPTQGIKEWDPVDRVGKDTLAWRQRFMSETECLSSEQIAEEATSRASNRAAMASRWVKSKKIFAVRYEGQQWFPRFQFQDGRPIPAVSQVIEVFPPHSSGWELAYFFVTPNSNLGGSTPVELLRRDPARLVSMAQAFVHPADVF